MSTHINTAVSTLVFNLVELPCSWLELVCKKQTFDVSGTVVNSGWMHIV